VVSESCGLENAPPHVRFAHGLAHERARLERQPCAFNAALQRPDTVTILYNRDHEFRKVRMNQAHPAKVVPSAHGDSVGHYEGDTLVIDTVGVKVGPYTMIDRLGTPYTEALHVVERYRLIDYEAAVKAQARGFKEWTHIPAYDVDPDYKGKGLQLEFTVEDEGVFTMPWKGIITYRRALRKFWDERICACRERNPPEACSSALAFPRFKSSPVSRRP
jgi:hypothetical protein